MSIQIGPTDIVKLKTLKDEISTGMMVVGKTGTKGITTSTVTYYPTDVITKSVDGIITSLTVNSLFTDKVYSYSFDGSTFTCRLKDTSSNTQVRVGFTVTYQPFNYVWGLKNSTGDWLWRKAKPYTVNFGRGVGSVIIHDNTDGSEEEITTSGTTVNLFYGGNYYIYGVNISSSYRVDISQDQTIDLSEESAENSPFSPSKFNSSSCSISSCTYWTMKIPAKTTYISSANVVYVYGGTTKTVVLTSSTQTVNVDFETEVYYSSITPVSGWTANYTSSNKFKPDRLNYELPALKVKLKDPTLTLKIYEDDDRKAPYYVCWPYITNPNPTSCYFQFAIEKNSSVTDAEVTNSLYDSISKNITNQLVFSGGFGFTWSSGLVTFNAKARLCLYKSDGTAVSGTNTTDFDVSPTSIISATTSIGTEST